MASFDGSNIIIGLRDHRRGGLPWLRICLPTHGTQVSIPGHGIKIPHATGQLISDSTTTEPMCSKT